MTRETASSRSDGALDHEVDRQVTLIMRGTAYGDDDTRATMERELRARLAHALASRRPLRVYLGVDPTSPDLHLGHCVALRKLRLFQDLGHEATLLIGDFTGLVGDPSDKDSLRPMRTEEELAQNARTYMDQASKVLDAARTILRRNSEWLGALTFRDVIRLASNFTVAQFLERDTFQKRLSRGDPVYLHEFLYGLMQGYDAYALQTDVQLGGTDQTFNIMAGRILQRALGQPPQIAVTSPILPGLDGKERMSKSAGNHIGIDEPPDEQYGKAMSLPDAAMPVYFTLATNLPPQEADALIRDLERSNLHPMDAKKRLAHAIVAEWHGPQAAAAAADHFARVFSQREQPQDMIEVALPFPDGRATVDLLTLLVDSGAVKSKGEARRLLTQGGITVDNERAHDATVTLAPGAVLRVGRRRWLRVVVR